MLFLGRDDVRSLLDFDALIDAVEAAMADLSTGGASMPPRVAAFVERPDGLLAAMPGYVPSLGALTAKLVTLFPGNADTAIPTHPALTAVFHPETVLGMRTGRTSADQITVYKSVGVAAQDAAAAAVVLAAARGRGVGHELAL